MTGPGGEGSGRQVKGPHSQGPALGQRHNYKAGRQVSGVCAEGQADRQGLPALCLSFTKTPCRGPLSP